ncbi:MAG: DUF4080 domain-containing protein [Verrucomicrobia bacterium]|nr:DUF4080 domain-containing protein [Verrucomicrobiota bacterium]
MPRILLAALNARYLHAAFGLRYLMANLGELRPEAALAEFDIQQRPLEMAEAILARRPEILGLGIYIWNVGPATELVALLRRIHPDLRIILGGPEVSHETDEQEIVRLADHVITGEADLAFAALCRQLLHPDPSVTAPPRIIAAGVPELAGLTLPYDLYSEEDAAHRVIYVEASRGCPFTCEFCLSSLDIPVRAFPLDAFLASMQGLLDRGVTRFKFVDRTFNLHLPTSSAILEFFLERWRPGLFVHFEMVPDRLPEPLREIIARFPDGALQFEIGIQTLNPEVEERIRRRQNHARLEDNLRWLRRHSGVHLHADLIAGLPGESLDSFAEGFDRLVSLGPQEIQVGLLKRLRGTPIGRHDKAFAMRYGPMPPYEVLQTLDLEFGTLARLRRFSRFWDLFGNSGLFTESLPLLWHPDGSPFRTFLDFSDALHDGGVRTHGVAPLRQYELLWNRLTGVLGLAESTVRPRLQSDFRRACRHEMPAWLRDDDGKPGGIASGTARAPGLRRQARHGSRGTAPPTAPQLRP